MANLVTLSQWELETIKLWLDICKQQQIFRGVLDIPDGQALVEKLQNAKEVQITLTAPLRHKTAQEDQDAKNRALLQMALTGL